MKFEIKVIICAAAFSLLVGINAAATEPDKIFSSAREPLDEIEELVVSFNNGDDSKLKGTYYVSETKKIYGYDADMLKKLDENQELDEERVYWKVPFLNKKGKKCAVSIERVDGVLKSTSISISNEDEYPLISFEDISEGFAKFITPGSEIKRFIMAHAIIVKEYVTIAYVETSAGDKLVMPLDSKAFIPSGVERGKVYYLHELMNAKSIYEVWPIDEIRPTDEAISFIVGDTVLYKGRGSIQMDVPAYIDKETGRTMVPVRFIAEAFGGEAAWEAGARSVSLKLGETAVDIALDEELPDGLGRAVLRDGRVMAPLRYIADTLDYEVRWNGTTGMVLIIK